MNEKANHRWPKRIRLSRCHYEIPFQITAITISCRYKQPYFSNHELTVKCIDSLRNASEQRSIDVLTYCFMPDHLHLLLQPTAHSNIIEFIQRYKSYTTRLASAAGYPDKIWQPRFYDHVLREHEDPMKHIRYITQNPVRAGLVDVWSDYPYVGSFAFDMNDFNW